MSRRYNKISSLEISDKIILNEEKIKARDAINMAHVQDVNASPPHSHVIQPWKYCTMAFPGCALAFISS